ncbi:MAG: hypothetical protein JWO05_1250 [Gemmatimonadetes bacterium]|nr:hypothetical protein [Gemmatimonadota bacterium]
MSKYTRPVCASLALALALVAGACSSADNKADSSALKSDSALNRDLALANHDSTAQPQLTDVPATGTTKAPATKTTSSTSSGTKTTTTKTPSTSTTASGNTVTKTPTTTGSAGGGGNVGTIAAGSTLSLVSNSKVCTNTNKVGDTFTGTVSEAVTGSNGAVIPAGATVTLRVTTLKRSENVNDKIVMEFAVQSISFGGRSYALDGSVASADVSRVRNQPKSKDVQKVVGGAVIGAIAGQVIGKNTKSTVIGAAAGAAAGAGAVAATSNYEGCVNSGATISVRTNSAMQVRV